MKIENNISGVKFLLEITNKTLCLKVYSYVCSQGVFRKVSIYFYVIVEVTVRESHNIKVVKKFFPSEGL